MCLALNHAHQRGVLHRDIKLDNILIFKNKKTGEKQVKLIDFGLSAILQPEQKSPHCCGSLAYSAPEIVDKTPHDVKADIWSLGICLYIILTGRLPFVTKS
jgi:serine/threonine protein kinase